jgi:Type II secretion system (T2SS), protein F
MTTKKTSQAPSRVVTGSKSKKSGQESKSSQEETAETVKPPEILVSKKTKELESLVPSAPAVATPRVVNVSDTKLGYFATFGLTKERDQFIENLSMLVLSGMPITGALTAITRDTKNPQMKKILENILVELDAGSPLWKSFDRTNLFKGYTVSLLRSSFITTRERKKFKFKS